MLAAICVFPALAPSMAGYIMLGLHVWLCATYLAQLSVDGAAVVVATGSAVMSSPYFDDALSLWR